MDHQIEYWEQRALKAEEINTRFLRQIESLVQEKASAVVELEEMANAFMDLATDWIRRIERFK